MTSTQLPAFTRGWQYSIFFLGLFWPGIAMVLIPQYVVSVTGSAADGGIVMGVIGIGALSAPVFGHMSDRYNLHRQTHIGGYLAVIAGLLLMGNTEDEMLLIVAAAVMGVGLAGAMLANNVYVTGGDLDQETESSALSRNLFMMFAGVVVGGFVIAGLLATDLDAPAVFAITAIAPAIGLVIAFLGTGGVARRVQMVSERRRATRTDSDEARLSFRAIVVSSFGLALLIVFLNHVGWAAIVMQYANYLEGAFGIDQSLTASVNSIAVGVSLLVVVATGRWAGRSGPLLPMSLGIAGRVLFAGVLVVLAATVGPEAVVLPLLVWSAMRLISPLVEATNPAVVGNTSPIGAAQAQAFLTVAYALAVTVGSTLGGGVAEEFGWGAAPWVTVAACGTALLLSIFFLLPRFVKPEAAIPPPSELVATEENAHL